MTFYLLQLIAIDLLKGEPICQSEALCDLSNLIAALDELADLVSID